MTTALTNTLKVVLVAWLACRGGWALVAATQAA